MYEPHLTGINSPPCILFRWSVWWDRYACGDEGAGRASGYRLVFAARLFIHFLTASPNRSTSCLLSMMLSSTQEITCLCFSHQSPLPAAVCPSSPVCFCILNFSSRCTLFPHQLLMTMLPSVSYLCFFCFVFLLLALRQSTSSQLHLIPSLLVWARWKHVASKAEWRCRRMPHVWWQERHFMHVCVWSDFNLTPVKSPQEIAGSMNAPLPSSVSASLMNYLSPQSIDAFSCILHPSRDSFICAVIIEGGRRYDMKAKVQLLPSLSPSVGASGCSISGWSRGVGKVSPSHFDAGARCW